MLKYDSAFFFFFFIELKKGRKYTQLHSVYGLSLNKIVNKNEFYLNFE